MSDARLTAPAQQVLRRAATLARERGHRRVGAAHLLAVLGPPGRQAQIEAALLAEPPGNRRPRLDSEIVEVLAAARRLAAVADEPVGPGHLLAALRAADPAHALADGLRSTGTRAGPVLPPNSARYLRPLGLPPRTGVGASRKIAVDALVRGLLHHRRRSVVLVGPRDLDAPGVVAGLCVRLAHGDTPAGLRGCGVLALDGLALVADAPAPGQLERRLGQVLADVATTGRGATIVFVDDLPLLLRTPAARAVLAGTLRGGGIRLVGTAGEWRPAGDALDELVWPLPLHEPGPEEAKAVLQDDVPRLAAHHGVRIEPSAVAAAVDYATRYLPDRRHPGKALDLLDEAAASVVMRTGPVVTADDVAAVVSEWTTIPLPRLLGAHGGHLLHLEERLHERVVGQHEAVTAVAAAIRRARAGVADRDRPLGSFLFLGPTGVGKTELARTLARIVFPDDGALVVLDMSEYSEAHAVARLVGAPPGYVGFGEGGRLSERLRARPHSVVLLDEIEKAHGDVCNVLLQVLDEGRLTDGAGETVDARDAVFVLTSNLGGQFITGSELAHAELRSRVLAEVQRAFRPELLNRLDEIVIFHRLTADHLVQIVDLQIAGLAERLRERRLALDVAPSARRWLAEQGYDPAYGARPLRRVIRRHVADPVATAVLEGRAEPGETIVVDVDPGGGLEVRPRPGGRGRGGTGMHTTIPEP